MSERCWYCRERPAEVWCDFSLGTVLVPPKGATAQLELGADPPAPDEVRETCDAAACRACAKRFGWRTIMSAIVCGRGRRHRGCERVSVDHCQVHAPEGLGAGEHGWVGGPAVDLARQEIRSACVSAFARAQLRACPEGQEVPR